jgi:predicted dehydrogenase
VLCEKPLARTPEEAAALVAVAAQSKRALKTGFNHRYHPAIAEAHRLACEGRIGRILVLRCRYGHGGRTGYEHEWRADRVSGGGELLDQGVHMVDLARWFLGDFTRVTGRTPSYFWKMPVEDNAFLLLETAAGRIAFLHAGWTEWKNLFSFEICGRDGKLEIAGMGGSYGTERLTFYKMHPEMGPPETTAWEFPMADNSWETEFADFLEDIRLRRQPRPGIEDAQAALRVVERVYRENGR